MQGIRDFLVVIDDTYESSITLKGQMIYLSSVFEDPFMLTKSAKVYRTPIVDSGIDAVEGDFLWFSHKITMQSQDKGSNRMANKYLVDGVKHLYRIPIEMVYAYTHNNDIHIPSPFTMVKPIERGIIVRNGIFLPGEDKEIPNMGTVEMTNPKMKNKKGDIVFFSKDSEYEIKMMGERYYRMNDSWILASYAK